MRKIILASSSPRRKEIFAKLCLPFETQESNYEEDMNIKMLPEKLAERLYAGKAGAYNLQEIGNLLVEKIEGDSFNAIGLPLRRIVEELENFGIKVL